MRLGRFFDYRDSEIVSRIQTALGGYELRKVLDTVSLPHTLKTIAQLVSPGATVVVLRPVNTPMPDGVELKVARFARCHDVRPSPHFFRLEMLICWTV
jgi:threonine dehydrogenase-like Zn-dependent dehydrogenase